MVQYRGPGADEVYAAARRVVDAGLRMDGSVFTPGAAIWTLERAEDLYQRFVQQPDTSSASFEQKLRRQLQGAPSATFQAMGELLFLHLLIAADVGGASKRGTIQSVLSWSPEPVTIPADLAAVLDNGLAKTGVAFKTYRPFQLWYLVEFLRAWKRLDAAARSRLLEDPWAFKEFASRFPSSRPTPSVRRCCTWSTRPPSSGSSPGITSAGSWNTCVTPPTTSPMWIGRSPRSGRRSKGSLAKDSTSTSRQSMHAGSRLLWSPGRRVRRPRDEQRRVK